MIPSRYAVPLSLTLFACASLFMLAPAIGRAQTTTSKVYTKGTHQMPGGSGLFGVTYTLVSSDGFGPVNFTLVSAEYSVGSVSIDQGNYYAPKANEKLLIIHYRLKNPTTGDMYYSSRNLFQAVDSNNDTILDSGESRRESATQTVAETMKPGQGIDDLFTYIVVPADTPIPKLILQLGRAGSSDKVTRYALGTAPNIVKPVPAPYADPSDKTGDTPLAQVPGALGTIYHAGFWDINVSAISLAPGPLGDTAADDGKQFLIATITATNKTLHSITYDSVFLPVLTTDDDQITDFVELKADHDDRYESREVDPGQSVTDRYVFQVPTDATLKTLSFANDVDNAKPSQAIVYDLSGVK